jgi:hypothetical protein
MKLSDLTTNEELISERLANDPAFRVEWERTALARAVALEVVRYRRAKASQCFSPRRNAGTTRN